MMGTVNIESNEAQILSRYLVGQDCSPEITQHYTQAVITLNASFTPSEQKIWSRMLAYSIYLKLMDSGLAIAAPQSALRKRIFIMLAILEASPDYVTSFLPQKRGALYLIPLGFRLALSAVYLVAGVIVVRIMGLSQS